MQDRFVGDIGDFGKYGLLRARAGVWPRAEPLLPLGVAWYIPDPDTIESTPSGHGQKVEYLFNPKLRDHCRNCDKQLFGRLKQVVCCERDIKAVEDSDLLGDSASGEVVFRSKPIPTPSVTQRQMQGPGGSAASAKRSSVPASCSSTPTPGSRIPRRPVRRSPEGSGTEAALLWIEEHFQVRVSLRIGVVHGPRRTVVWYQSFGRRGDHEGQAREWRRRLGQAPALDGRQLHITEYESRAFAILPGEEDEETVVERLKALGETASPWNTHFRQLCEGSP